MNKTNKTIGLVIRLWTDDLEVKNSRKNLSCWDSGMVSIESNKEKNIKSRSILINSFEDIKPAIKKLLRDSKILLVSDGSKPRVDK